MDPRLSASLEGRYIVDREIGRGGMATVYLARDVKHNRNVALKVLNRELGAVLGVERFLAEIQVTANLQHPNLLPLFDSGEAHGLLFYVMPYVEGETLRARLAREKQLPVDEAVRIAVSIANALEYAHGHGVIHRDLKPENILMQSGQAVIADFGIALAVSNAGGARVTQTGLSLGTPQYMSPEQATADRAVDGRTDIYSLGAMTYEMLVGDPPHVASTAQAIIAKVLTEKPASVRTSRPNVSPAVEYAIGRALEKFAADRFATAKDFAEALEGKGAPAPSPAYQQAASGSRPSSRVRELTAWSLVLVLAAWFGWQHLRPHTPAEQPVIRANFDLPLGARIMEELVGNTFAVSPDGNLIAFTSTSAEGFKTYVRRINELTARVIGNEQVTAGRNLTFSPDNRWLAFSEGNVLKKVAVDGGPITTIATLNGISAPMGLAWLPSDSIYIGSFMGLFVVPASGGAPTEVLKGESLIGKRWPLSAADGSAILYVTGNTSGAVPQLMVWKRESPTATPYPIAVAMPLGLLNDQLVYVSPTGGLMAMRFDRSALRPVGEAVQLDDEVYGSSNSGRKASLSSSGTLAYIKGQSQFQAVLATPMADVPLLKQGGAYSYPRFSPDGGRVAITVSGVNSTDIYVYQIASNTFMRLTTDGMNNRPEWTSDGQYVVFVSIRANKAGIWWQRADGSAAAELLYQPEVEPYEAIISPDLKWLVFRTAPGEQYSRDILAVPMTGERTITPIVTGPFTESMPRFSPDGRWLAYMSNDGGRNDVYVRPFPGPGARTPLSDNGGSEPLWGRDGRSIYYRGLLGEVIKASVTAGGSFAIGERKVVLSGDYLVDSSHPSYDVGPDGRLLMLKRSGGQVQPVIVHNWGRELREKTAPKK